MRTVAPESRDYFRLRAEWLRFKNHVIDANTELPTLAAVLDDVRRLVEERGTAGVVYIDLGGDPQVETVHGWLAYDDLLRSFSKALRSLLSEGPLGPRDRLAALSIRSDKFLVFLGGSGSAALDASSLAATATRLRERLGEALARHGTAPISFHDGHALLQRDPM